MKRFIYILIVLIAAVLLSSVSKGPDSKGSGLRWKTGKSVDTAEVNRYSRLALQIVIRSDKPVWKKDESIGIMKAFIDTAEMLCKKKNIELPGILHLARAEYFYKKNDFKNSYQEAVMAMNLAESLKDTKILLSTMNLLGRYSLRTGSLSESLDYFDKGIRMAEKEKLKGYIPVNYFGMADVWIAMGDTIQYRKMAQRMIESANEEKDSVYKMLGFYILGTSLTEHPRDFKKADSLLRKGLEIATIRKDSSLISRSLANMGWNFYKEKKYNEAIKLYNKSLQYSIPARLYFNSANSLGNLGTIYRDMDNTEKALFYYRKSIYHGEQGNDAYNLSWVYDDMSQMYLRKKDTVNAFKSFVLFKKYSDAHIRSTSSKGLTDAMIRYEASAQAKENELLTLRVRNQQLLIYGYTGLIILSLTIGLLMFNRSRINARNRLSELNRKVSEVTQANLRQQMNPHFIFNTLNSIQYYMYQNDKLATNNYLTKFSSLMRKVLENSQHTSIPLRDELEALELYLELEKIRFKEKFDYKIRIDEEIDTILYKVPTMLIQPYVENSISHGLMPGAGKGMITIDLNLKNDHISCIIEDNGIGREAAEVKKNSHHNSLGTQIVSSRLELVNALYGTNLKTIYTDLKSNNGNPEGTRVEIHIPLLT
jgi:tetratricopeptide (TPR) repeat protein